MGLASFNTAPVEEVTSALTACCDVPRWVETVRDNRPYDDTPALLAVADSAARAFTDEDVDRALRAHPRIGGRLDGRDTESAWSRGEQAGVDRDEETLAALADINGAYEQRFGRVFLICASNKSADEVLAAARARLRNDDGTEARVVAEELRQIALLRLRKLVES